MFEFASDLIGSSPAMIELRRQVEVAARSNARVLITGESGVGKEVVARSLHRQSLRRALPFRAVNCSGIPDTLLASELFGYVRGSFTGAVRDHQGVFEAARGGTVLLDHVEDSSLSMQALLLRFVQFGEIQRVGEDETTYVDVRVVATTHGELLDHVADGAFRMDLYYRLNVIRLHVPPLRERREDIPALVNHFAVRLSQHYQTPCPTIDRRIMESLTTSEWPGNVRQLQNAVERFIVRGPEMTLTTMGVAAGVDEQGRSERTGPTLPKGDGLYALTISPRRSFR